MPLQNIRIFLNKSPKTCKTIQFKLNFQQKPFHTNAIHLNKLIISAKRKQFNFFANQNFNKFEPIELASKGWTHNKSQGDFFTVHGDVGAADKPEIPFKNLEISNSLVEAIKELNITKATKFQSQVIPVVGLGKHTLIAAETGCGKTLAYLLPLINNLIGNKREELNTPNILILTPNRELAHQIGQVASHLAQAVDLNVKVVVGGGTKKLMMNPEFAPIDILVGTPGAIGKLISVGIYKVKQLQTIVLDEADTLMDDSFNERIQHIYTRASQAQIIFTSATLPKNIPAVFEPIIERLVQLKSERLHKPLLNITQHFLRLSKSAKPSQLLLIANKAKSPLIVFTNRNETCNWLAMFLRENGIKCSNINGDMNYAIRIQQWNDFVSGHTKILSATDVGSRGLDTTQVNHVLNYDFPLYTADYIHRIGRTGRLGSSETSKVTNFIAGLQEINLVQNIEMAIRTNGELKNVDGNITKIVQRKIENRMRSSAA